MHHIHSVRNFKDQPVYCETLHAGEHVNTYLSEPVNAFSNIFIFIAVAVLAYLVKKSGLKKTYLWVSVGLLLLNAIGSWLWHSTKNKIWLPLDVLPAILLLMILIYYWVMHISNNKTKAIIIIACVSVLPLTWIALIFTVIKPDNPLILPLGFLAIMLSIFAYLIWQTKVHAQKHFSSALLLFGALVLSAIMRSIDIPLCELIPFGTHWLWHLGLSISVVLAYWFIIKLEKESQSTNNRGN